MKLGNLFSDEIDSLSVDVYQKRMLNAAVAIGAAACLGTAIINPNQPKSQLGWQLFLSTTLGFASGYMSYSRDELEKRFKSFVELNREAYKEGIKNDASLEFAEKKIVGELQLASKIRALPQLQAQERYRKMFALDGLGLGSDNPKAIQASEEISDQGNAGKSNNVAIPDIEVKNQFIDKKADSMIKQLANQYPGLLKIDGSWITELIDSSTDMNLSKRLNHHFYLCGETQSGKSTLAGVIASGLASRSESPAVVAIHDAKTEKDGYDTSNWLCDFTYKINDFSGLGDWLKLSAKLIKEQSKEIGNKPLPFTGVKELILIQDEIDTIYGQGKGYGNIIPTDKAIEAKTFWMSGSKVLAGKKGHMIFMGQSPLTQDNGFNRPSLKNMCFICMNQTTDYILGNAKDFITHMSAEEIELLKEFCKLFEKVGLRYCLVRPMKGNAYVAIVPNFGKVENNQGIAEEIDEEELYDEETTEEIENTEDTKQTDRHGLPISNEKTKEAFKLLLDYLRKEMAELGTIPSDEEIREAWKYITETDLPENTLKLLKEHLTNGK